MILSQKVEGLHHQNMLEAQEKANQLLENNVAMNVPQLNPILAQMANDHIIQQIEQAHQIQSGAEKLNMPKANSFDH